MNEKTLQELGGRRRQGEGGGAREELLFALGLDGRVRVQSVERWVVRGQVELRAGS